VTLWDAVTRQQLASLLGHSNQVQALAFSPDSKLLATGNFDNTVILWDLAARRRAGRVSRQPGNQAEFSIWCVAFAPDGETLVVGNDDGTLMSGILARAGCYVRCMKLRAESAPSPSQMGEKRWSRAARRVR